MTANTAPGCFACGPDHPAGLRLVFTLDHAARTARAHTVLAETFAGADGIAHGGIVATLLDEAMAHASRTVVPLAATAKLTVRYRLPTPVGVPLEIDARVLSFRHQAVRCQASIRREGTILAAAEATLLVAQVF